jgi:hypothetical protein
VSRNNENLLTYHIIKKIDIIYINNVAKLTINTNLQKCLISII